MYPFFASIILIAASEPAADISVIEWSAVTFWDACSLRQGDLRNVWNCTDLLLNAILYPSGAISRSLCVSNEGKNRRKKMHWQWQMSDSGHRAGGCGSWKH